MYTVDEIRNITFTKSLGGYKTSEVDDFIDICADTVEELNKNNEDLKKKMEMLANKVVEYRNDEDSIRTALLNAQRMGDTVLKEANHKAGLILDDAKIKADKIEETAKQQIQDQIDELERLKKLVSDFKTQILGIYREHLSMIDVLPEYQPPAAEAEQPDKAEEAAQETEEEAAAPQAPAQPAEETPAAPEPETAPAAKDAPDMTEKQEEIAVDAVPLYVGENAASPAESGRFANLKFGVDYNLADDLDDDGDKRRKRHK